MVRRMGRVLALAAVLAGTFAAGTAPASANHSWGSYHWARTANPFTLKLGDNVSSAWDSYLDTTITDWSQSSVLDTTKVAGGTSPKACRATEGRVEVCNAAYGPNGWLGLATIWASGNHITKGTAKLNDTYFNTASYNTPAWRNFVMCQEVGHTFGLGHQDEDFNNLDLLDVNGKASCMDYSNNPSENQHPNQHDYDQLVTIYSSHTDLTNTFSSTSPSGSPSGPADPGSEPGDDPSTWGRPVKVRADGRPIVYEQDLGRGQRRFVFVVWADGTPRAEAPGHHHGEEH